MKIIDGKNAILGRLASFTAKEALKGEEIAIVNCEEIIITGNKKSIEKDFKAKASRYGTSQKGPTHHKASEKIVKKVIRGMLPNYREGRGREAFKRIKCYKGIPKEFEDKKMIKAGKGKKGKYSKVGEFAK
ncbi:MAG: 50S ribosomal protein L13 [Candidatus Pacearchaeota archaeon]|jgi:large subunit ribosomal protein L13